MIKVSVVIPVFNAEKYIIDCLESVLSQTLEEIEVICIDDASPDGCPEILDEFARKDSRVRVIHLEQNRQQGHGRNLGLAESCGKYVYFLDSDDLAVPEALEELYEKAEAEDLDGIFFDAETLLETDDMKDRYRPDDGVRKGDYSRTAVPGKQLFSEFARQDEWNVYVQRQFWRREYLAERGLRFPELPIHEDELFSFCAILQADRVCYTDRRLAARRYRPGSLMTSRPSAKSFFGYFTTYCRMMDFMREQDHLPEECETVLAHMLENVYTFWPVFREEKDPDAWFSGRPEEERYQLFSSMQRSGEINAGLNRKIWEPLRRYRRIWLYGAGMAAARTMERLRRAGYMIEGVIVTDKACNPERFGGLEVTALADYRPLEDRTIVVATGKGLHEEIAELLEKRGLSYWLYARAVLEGPFGEDE